MFKLTEVQVKQLFEWRYEQDKKIKDSPVGANGGVYSYTFTPTTLGVVILVKNNINQEEINLTNFGDW